MPTEANVVAGLYPFGSYGPAAGVAGAAVSDETDVEAAGAVAAAADGDVSLSASALAGEFGKAPGAVPAVAAGDVTGIDMLGGRFGKPATPAFAAGAPAAARFVDDGEAAGVRPAIATGVGVDWLDGSLGSAERATADASGKASFFQNAHFGPD